MDVFLKYLNAKDEVEEMKLSDGGYSVEKWTPQMMRAWGTYEGHLDVTILVPLERVLEVSLVVG